MKGGIGILLGVPREGDGVKMDEDPATHAMRAFAKALKGNSTSEQLDAFKELMACCDEGEAEAEDSEESDDY